MIEAITCFRAGQFSAIIYRVCCFLKDISGVDRTSRGSGTGIADRVNSSNRLRLFGFGLFAAIYFLSFLQRVAVSVVADDLAMELGLDSVALGFMSSGFFIAYALVQPAMGLLCDKAGPERVSAGALAIAAAGSFLFAGARGFASAFLGRILMGMGLAAGFIPGMKVIAAMFPPEAFSTYNGLFVAIGNAGALMGAAPLAWLTVLVGWRLVFAGLAFAAVLLAALCWLFAAKRHARAVPDSGPGDEPGSNRDVMRSRELRLLALFLFMKYGSQVAFQGLWGVPYIASVYRVSPTTAAGAVTMVAVGYVVAAPFVGKLADVMAARGMNLVTAQRRLLVATTLLYVATWVPIVLAPGFLPLSAMYVLLFVMGISVSSASLVFGIAKALFPSNVSGLAIGLVNITSILGGAAMPPVVGWFIDRLAAAGLQGGAVYSTAMIPCLLAAALGLALVSMVGRPARTNMRPGYHAK
jgi:MFS family permease